MASDGFRTGIALRVAMLLVTTTALSWMIVRSHWYATMTLCMAAAVSAITSLFNFASRSEQEVARFLDAISFEDPSQTFAHLREDSAHGELGVAMTRVLDRLRASRREREEQSRYLHALLTHVPVALLSLDEHGEVRLLNRAARRLFDFPPEGKFLIGSCGEAFAAIISSLQAGESATVKMERTSAGALQMKAAATAVVLHGLRTRLISLQNIESELSAQELAAWQTVIRVMAHEVANSLTPISSLTQTANDLIRRMLTSLPNDSALEAPLRDVSDALAAASRRGEGLLHFVQGYRRLTKRLVAQREVVALLRVFARMRRLFASEMQAREICLETIVEPETLELAVDVELLDQALVNLIRNGIEALSAEEDGRIFLSAARGADGRVVVSVADNGPGIPPSLREKVFVPFFSTKRRGSGVGLTLVRQIAVLHGATVRIADRHGGGTTVSLHFQASQNPADPQLSKIAP